MLTFRLAEERDAEPFSNWIADSTQIPVEDVQASLKENNPTSVTIVIEDQEGKVILFAPTYAVAMLGFLGINPDSTPLQRGRALRALKGALQAFWKTYGVTEINTLTREDYPIAQWALANGFDVEPRTLVRLITKPDTGSS